MSDADFRAWKIRQSEDSNPNIVGVDPDTYEPTTEEAAWWAGFGLGIEGLDVVAPDDFDAARRASWKLGYESGWGNYAGQFTDGDERDFLAMYPEYDPLHPEEQLRAIGSVEYRKDGERC